MDSDSPADVSIAGQPTATVGERTKLGTLFVFPWDWTGHLGAGNSGRYLGSGDSGQSIGYRRSSDHHRLPVGEGVPC